MKRHRKTTRSRDGIIHSERKVIQIGGAVGVSFPKEWLKEQGIEVGDTLSLMANSILTVGKIVPKLRSEGEENG